MSWGLSVSNTHYHTLALRYWSCQHAVSCSPTPGCRPGEDAHWCARVVLPIWLTVCLGISSCGKPRESLVYLRINLLLSEWEFEHHVLIKPQSDVCMQIFEVWGLEMWGKWKGGGMLKWSLSPVVGSHLPFLPHAARPGMLLHRDINGARWQHFASIKYSPCTGANALSEDKARIVFDSPEQSL